MLIAEPAELLREKDSPLATHLAGCDDCRRTSAIIAGATRQLGVTIASRATVAPQRISRRASGLALVPVAAAAVFVVMISNRVPRRAEPRVSRTPLPVARTVSLEVGRGQQATMLKTADPKVTVIWLSSGEGK
jgi:hypothetical protein